MGTEYERLNPADSISHTTITLSNGHTLQLTLTPKFPISPYTRFFLADLPDFKGRRVLDFGTGCGVLALAAAKLGAESVVACDVSPEAIELAATNILTNSLESVSLVKLDTTSIDHFTSNAFDLIICNPASLPTPSEIPRAYWSGGHVGLDMIVELIEVSSRCLSTAGRLRFIHTSLAPLHFTLHRLAHRGFSTGILRVEEIPFRAFYERLFAHLLDIRRRYGTFFDEHDGMFYEHLYLLEAFRSQTRRNELAL